MSIFVRTFAMLMICLLSVIQANAADRMFAGSYCQPQSKNNDVGYGHFGVFNGGASEMGIECPFWLPYSGSMTVAGVDVTVYDRHPTANVTCTARIISLEGNVVTSRTMSTSGSSGPHKFLVMNFNNAGAVGTLHMSCSVPPPFNGNLSHVTTYRLRTNL